MRSVMQDMISLPTPGTVNMNGPHPSSKFRLVFCLEGDTLIFNLVFQFNLVTMPPQTISVEMPIQMEIRTPTAPPPTRATPQQASPTNNQARPTGNTQVDTASLIAGVVSSMAQGSDQSLAQFLQGLGETVDMENEGNVASPIIFLEEIHSSLLVLQD